MVSSSPVLAVDQGVYAGRLVAVNLWKQKLHIVYRTRMEYYGDDGSWDLASHLSAEDVIPQLFCPDRKTTSATCRAAGLVPPTLQWQSLWIRKVLTPLEDHNHSKVTHAVKQISTDSIWTYEPVVGVCYHLVGELVGTVAPCYQSPAIVAFKGEGWVAFFLAATAIIPHRFYFV